MRKLGVVALVSAVALGVVSSCGKDEGPSPTPIAGSERYKGSLVGPGDLAGTLTLDLGAAVVAAGLHTKAAPTKIAGTVTVNVPGVGPIAVEGTIEASGSNAKFQGTGAGGLLSFEGTLVDGVLSGTYTSPWGAGPFSVTRDDVVGLKLYCGAFAGGLGRIHLFTLGAKGGGVYAGGASGVFLGSFVGGKLKFSLASGGGDATLSGTTMSGSFTADAPLGGATFSATEAGCGALAPRTGGDAGTDGGTDGATDGATDGGASDPLELYASSFGSDQLSFPVRYGKSVFVARTGAAGKGILEVPVDGGKATEFAAVAGSDGSITGLATDGKDVYWQVTGAFGASDGRVDHKSVLGAPTATSAVSGLDFPNVLTTDGTSLYSTGSSGKTVRFDASGALKNTTFGTGISDLVADGTYVWLAPGPSGPVSRWSKDFTGVVEILSTADLGSTNVVRYLAQNGADLFAVAYPSDFSSYVVLKKAKDGTGAVTTLVTIAKGTGSITGIVADATHVYFAGFCGAGPGTGCIRRVPRGGGAIDTLATGLQSPREMALDDSYVFYGDVTRLWRKKK